jgi:anti-sigma B factor antagonist
VAVLKIDDLTPAAKPGDVALLKVTGEVDLDTVKQLADKLNDVVEKRAVTRLVLDMEKTEYVNSTALATLVKFSEKCRERGGGFALANTIPRVKLVFEMLGLLPFFKFFDSVDKAKASFTAAKK